MTRTLIFAGLAAVSLLIPSCFPIVGFPSSGKSLVLNTAKELEIIKRETDNTIMLTARKVKGDEMSPNTGKEIIDSLKVIIKNADSLLTVCAHLNSSGSREERLRFIQLAGASIQNEKKTLNCLNDLYNISTPYQFETDTYFPAGGFRFPPDKLDEAKKSVEPIVQRIIKFLNDNPGQNFVAVIRCYGFTDETPIPESFWNPPGLVVCVRRTQPTRQELAVKISELRAKALAMLVHDQIKSYEEFIPNMKLVIYDVDWLGKGEALPYPDKIKDYKPDDKRRRLVQLTWHLLPGSLYVNKCTWLSD
jgi:hypothetical protein